MKACILTIGDEILNGTTIDTNSAFIAQHSELIGLSIHQSISVSDTYEGIHKGLNYASNGSEVVFITGGLGPTKDDITKKALADYFEDELVFNAGVFEKIKAYFEKRGAAVVERNRKLAMIPISCTLVPNDKGTALGMWFEQNEVIYISMPGVPHEMKHMLLHHVFPKIKETKRLINVYNRYIMTAGLGESSINEKIADIESALPSYIKLAYLPSLGRVKLRLTALENAAQHVEEEILTFQSKIAKRLPKYVYSTDEKISLEESLGKLLKENNATISTAESCTGGYIGHCLTSVAGSSAYYEGTIVSYSYDIKEKLLGVKHETLVKEGAVSEATVREMLQGVLQNLETDYAISVSGIAGPGGGMPGKPVGTVWIAVGSKEKIVARKYQLTPHRKPNIEITSVIALNLIRRFILGELKD